MNLEEIIGIPFLFALIGWILWLWLKKRQLDMQERMKRLDIHHEMIKKFSSTQEFIDFLQTEHGKPLMLNEETTPQLRALRSLLVAIVLILAGIVMLINGYSWRDYDDMNYVNKMHDLYYWGSMAIAIGLGLLIHLAIMLKLGKKWNVFKDRE